jgi:anaerobic ribonucleoside-triphosphate reductase
METDWEVSKVADTLVLEAHLDRSLAEEIASSVEKKLLKLEQDKVSTLFIRSLVDEELALRGKERKLMRQKLLSIPTYDLEESLFSKTKENSNVACNSPEAVNMYISETIIKQYALNRVFSNEVSQAHLNGIIHIHDLGYANRAYCGAHSIEKIKREGLNLRALTSQSAPAKHAHTLTGHLNTFLSIYQGLYAGALGLAYLNTFYSPMLVGMTEKQIEEEVQYLVFSLNQTAYSRGGQSIFIDANIDLECPEFLKKVPCVVSGGMYCTEFLPENLQTEDIEKLRNQEDFRKTFWVLHKDRKKANKSSLLAHLKNIGRESLLEKINLDTLKSKVLTFGDFEVQSQTFCKKFMEVLYKGDKNGSLLTFPKLQLHVGENTFKNEKTKDLFLYACDIAGDKGITNFVFDRDAVSLSACITSDTPILHKIDGKIRYGVLPLNHLGWKDTTNLEIIGVDGSFKKVKSLFCKEIKEDVYLITLSSGETLSVTHDHPFLNVRKNNSKNPLGGKIKLAEELIVGDRLEGITPKYIKEGIRFIDLKEYDDDNILTDKFYKQNIGHKNELINLGNNVRAKKSQDKKGIPNKLELTYNLGRFVGIFIAEGYTYKGKYSSRSQIDLNINEKILSDFICSFLQEELNVRISLKDISANNGRRITFSSNLVNFILKLFYSGGTASEKNLTDLCFSANGEFREGLINGILEGDGNFNKKSLKGFEVGLHLSSELLVNQFKVLLTTVGIRSTGVQKTLCRNHRNPQKTCTSFRVRICNLDVLKLKTPYLLKIQDRLKYLKRSSSFGNGVLIKEINKIYYEGPVFNFEMEDIHEYSLQGIRSKNCCRLKETVVDTSILEYPEKIRFCGVQNVSINLPQASLRAEGDVEKTIKEIKKAMDIAVKAHLQKKKFLSTLMDSETKPLFQLSVQDEHGQPYVDLDKSTYIIGLIGLNECVKRITGKDLHADEETYKIGIKIITSMFLYIKQISKDYNLKFSLEESPGESAGARFAKIDYNKYGENSFVRGNKSSGDVYYTNSVHLVPDSDISIVERIEKQSRFAQLIESGSITHCFIQDQKPPKESVYSLVKKTFENTQCAQLTISPELVFCPVCGFMDRGFDNYI